MFTKKGRGIKCERGTFDKGETLSEWCRKLGLKRKTISQRINAYGWDIKRALELK